MLEDALYIHRFVSGLQLWARRGRRQLTLEVDDPERLKISGTDQDVRLLLVHGIEQVARTAFDRNADLHQARGVLSGDRDVLVRAAVRGVRRCRVLHDLFRSVH